VSFFLKSDFKKNLNYQPTRGVTRRHSAKAIQSAEARALVERMRGSQTEDVTGDKSVACPVRLDACELVKIRNSRGFSAALHGAQQGEKLTGGSGQRFSFFIDDIAVA
jgi:hypothetical protein